MKLRAGDSLPPLPLAAIDGGHVALDDLRGRATLLVFLRHLA